MCGAIQANPTGVGSKAKNLVISQEKRKRHKA
jgi:hypothetical protein